MILEFYGLPGSGKSTVARYLKKTRGFKVIKIENKRELFFYNLIFLFKYPVKFFALLYYLLLNGENSKLFYYKFMNTFLQHNAKYIKAKSFKRDEKLIIDQGHFQNIISVFKKNVSSAYIENYLKFVPIPDKLFIFEIGEEERRERLLNRGHNPRGGYGKNYQKKWNGIIIHNNNLFMDVVGRLNINYAFVKDGEIKV